MCPIEDADDFSPPPPPPPPTHTHTHTHTAEGNLDRSHSCLCRTGQAWASCKLCCSHIRDLRQALMQARPKCYAEV